MAWVHLSILLITACVILCADHLGYLYVRGRRELLEAHTIQRLHYLVWAGLIGMIATGTYMAADRIQYLIQQPVFVLKMGFVLMLVINAFFIRRLSLRASEVPFVHLSIREKIILGASGVVSLAGWVGAACIGYFFL